MDDIRGIVLGTWLAAYAISRVVRLINGARTVSLFNLSRSEAAVTFVVVAFVYTTSFLEVRSTATKVCMIIGAGIFVVTICSSMIRRSSKAGSDEDATKDRERERRD